MGRFRQTRRARRRRPAPATWLIAAVLRAALVLVAGSAAAQGGVDRGEGVRWATIDTGRGDDVGLALALGADERLVVAGRGRGAADDDLRVARCAPDGTPDATFGDAGTTLVDLGGGELGQAIVLQDDGGVLVAGSTGEPADLVLVRLRGDGTLDPGFGAGGSVATDLGGDDRAHALAAYPDGRVLVAGTSRGSRTAALVVVRHLANGRLDPAFGDGGRMLVELDGRELRPLALAMASDGSVVVVGAAGEAPFIARLRADGARAAATGDDVVLLALPDMPAAGAALIDASGRIVLAGSTPGGAGIVLARVDADGRPDTTFGIAGRLHLAVPGRRAIVRGLATDAQGSLVVVGSAPSAVGDDLLLARVPASGDARCGDAVVDPGEACDHGERNGAHGSCCDASCALETAGATCRPSLGACDPAEVCDGTTAHCPDDAWAHAGAPCRAAAGACDVAETCSGSGPECPRDDVRSPGTVCRVATGACDLDEKCDGVTAQCPADRKKTSVCRSARGSCDQTEWCDGVANDCPADGVLPDGSACDDGNACTVDDVCVDADCHSGARDPRACSGYLCSTVKDVTVLAGSAPTVAELGDGSGALTLRTTRSVCVPVLAAASDPGEGAAEDDEITDARSGYTAYGVSRRSEKAARRRGAARDALSATLTNQFGSLDVGFEQLRLVSVPASLGADEMIPADPGAGRYECHAIAVRGAGAMPGEVSVRAASDDVARRFTVRRPRQACRPVGTTGVAALPGGDELLVCYDVKALRADGEGTALTPLVASNPYETWLVRDVGQQHLCVPAELTDGFTTEIAASALEPRKRQVEREGKRKRKRLARARDPERKPARKRPKRAAPE